MKREREMRSPQGGGVLVLFGISLAVLIGFLGIVVDLGRLFVTKTELQTAMDACALAAASELRPGLNPPDLNAVDRAVSAGVTAGTRNSVDLQAAPAVITAANIYFSDRLSNNTTTFPFGYVPAAAAANPTNPTVNPATARYVLCARAQTGIATWFMQVLEGFLGGASTPNTVGAWATATTAPAQTACGIPLGICKKPGFSGPDWGFTPGEWVSGRFDAGGGLTGSFNWIDFSPPAGGASELAALLAGQGACNLDVTTPVGQSGIIGNAAARAWNSRFGLYQGGGGNPNLTTAPPDHSGYAYTPTNWPSEFGAFSAPAVDGGFQAAKRNAYASYGDAVDTVDAGNTITGLSISNAYRVTTHGTGGEHDTGGADRRVATAPIINCPDWESSQTVPILGWVCVFMLHPISGPGEIVRMEYLGSASTLGSPCTTYGIAGGTAGPLVPVLVH